ncbi:MAG: alanine--tRNA ligase-related protein [Solobacterium sp.]|jgi:alanyl-tRNA synthetase|nr:alanine--tRNA ligase-related protein [Solobacterium sp.]MCH4205329.1 alanine--tRNA ligase-related protein [Solobacterium sp.]MCH4226974.1 alanine--tRNA ligase-related protein [Solobacterium sp.]MCH4282234.1 alanine--tRNA ligase-related protein [Solobacterium sp.]
MMMEEMNELFYREPYTREFDAEVIGCTHVQDHYEIILNDTAFYPEGGGQPCDTGTLDQINITDVQRRNGVIVHCADVPLPLGKKVHGVLDWQRRFEHMQEHSGEHLVSGLIFHKYGFDNVGFHMGETIQVDFSGSLSFEEMRQIEVRANEVIWQNEPIEISYPSPEELQVLSYRSKKELHGRVRIVTIPDGDVCACCGTHTASTGEIGLIRILSAEKHKNGTRVQMLAGRRALQYDQAIFDQDHEISVLLSSEMKKTGAAVKELMQKLSDQRYQIGALQKELMTYQLQDYEADQPLAMIYEKDMDRETMRAMAIALVEKKNCRVAAVLCGSEDAYGYVLVSHTVDLKKYSRLLNESLHGAGGGTSDILQGNFRTVKEDISDLLKQLFANLEP